MPTCMQYHRPSSAWILPNNWHGATGALAAGFRYWQICCSQLLVCFCVAHTSFVVACDCGAFSCPICRKLQIVALAKGKLIGQQRSHATAHSGASAKGSSNKSGTHFVLRLSAPQIVGGARRIISKDDGRSKKRKARARASVSDSDFSPDATHVSSWAKGTSVEERASKLSEVVADIDIYAFVARKPPKRVRLETPEFVMELVDHRFERFGRCDL